MNHLLENLANMSVYALVGVLLMFLGFKVFDWLTPKINFTAELVEQKNPAVGIMVGAIILGVAAIVVTVIAS